MSYKPSDSYAKEFTTAGPTTGAATNADSLPVATADFAGTGTGSMALTVTNLDAGRYSITGTIPAGRARGDVLNVSIAATVGGVAGKAIVDTQVLDSKRVGDLNDIAATAIVSSGAITTSLGAVSNVTTTATATNLTNPVAITSNVKKNQALNNYEFVMTDSTTHAPKTGVTVTATRSLDGAAFGACANAASEVTSGVYKIDLATTDTNGNVITLRFTGTGADDLLVGIITQP